MPTQLPEIVRTTESFPKDTPKRQVEAKAALYRAAGAIRSQPSRDPATEGWIVTTDWELFDGNDSL
jgi:hypothetical protein